jgi:NADH dehydrogenase FAD-containing subunit
MLEELNIEAASKIVNDLDVLDKTALHYATEKGNLEMVKILYSVFGCNLDIQDGKGNTALHIAIMNKNDEIKIFLIENKANMNLKNNSHKSSKIYLNVERKSINLKNDLSPKRLSKNLVITKFSVESLQRKEKEEMEKFQDDIKNEEVKLCFKSIIENNETKEIFQDFLKEKKFGDMITFYEQVLDYSYTTYIDIRKTRANKIRKQFLEENSPYEIKINDRFRKEILNKLDHIEMNQMEYPRKIFQNLVILVLIELKFVIFPKFLSECPKIQVFLEEKFKSLGEKKFKLSYMLNTEDFEEYKVLRKIKLELDGEEKSLEMNEKTIFEYDGNNDSFGHDSLSSNYQNLINHIDQFNEKQNEIDSKKSILLYKFIRVKYLKKITNNYSIPLDEKEMGIFEGDNFKISKNLLSEILKEIENPIKGAPIIPSYADQFKRVYLGKDLFDFLKKNFSTDIYLKKNILSLLELLLKKEIILNYNKNNDHSFDEKKEYIFKKKKKLIVIGGRYAGFQFLLIFYIGMRVIKGLLNIFDITLIDKNPYFEFNLMFHRLFTDPNLIKTIEKPMKNIFEGITVITDLVLNVSPSSVYLNNGQVLNFDYLVISTGSYYKVPFPIELVEKNLNYKENSNENDENVSIIFPYSSKSIIIFNLGILYNYQKMMRSDNIVIIGGGAVALEITGEILENFKKSKKNITLISQCSIFLEKLSKGIPFYFNQDIPEGHKTIENIFLKKYPNLNILFNCVITKIENKKIFFKENIKDKLHSNELQFIEADTIVVCTGNNNK